MPRRIDISQHIWRSSQELHDAPSAAQRAFDEFLPGAMDHGDGVSRRSFLQLLSAAITAVGLTGCKRKVDETIVPYVRQPAGLIPGKPMYFATAMTLAGYAQGVQATSREYRPVKTDGNAEHSSTLGSSDVFMQASLLDLYDPDRSKTVMRGTDISDWDSFVAEIMPRLPRLADGSSGVAILSETITSPTLLAQIDNLKKLYRNTRWYVHEPVGRENVRAALRSTDGREVLPTYDFSRASVIVSLDCDFLSTEPGHVRYARDFADARKVTGGNSEINRLYVLECSSTITGSVADYRWAVRPSKIASLTNELLAAVNNPSAATGWARGVADDLLSHRGTSLVLAGAHHSPDVHRAVHQINVTLQNIGKTVTYRPSMEGNPDGTLADLIASMEMQHNATPCDTLLILGGNPAYTSPADLDFAGKLQTFSTRLNADGTPANLTIRLGHYDDETSVACQWHLPQTHYLEEWGDGRGHDGSVAMIQPLIDPLYLGRSGIEVLELLRVGYLRSGYDIVRSYWRSQYHESDFDRAWSAALERGTWPDGVPDAVEVGQLALLPAEPSTRETSDGFEVAIRPDPNIWDGRYFNNGFLQELPRPMTKLTWDNAAIMSPASAVELGVSNGDMVHLAAENSALDAAVWILPGQPDRVITLHLGFGRTRGTRVVAGFNANLLRTSVNPWHLSNVQVTRTGTKYELVSTHTHQTMAARKMGDLESKVVQPPGDDELDNRRLIRAATLRENQADPNWVQKLDAEEHNHPLTLYSGFDNVYKQNLAWGMSIDLQSCIGCNACIVACQTENNIAVVGKDQVSRGREMHWIRVDTYFEGPEEKPTAAYHQPVPCQQCENAPCELVCPVGATVHDDEGINNMVYNRCVGTRYCSNNCPYKVRRFNFYYFQDETTETYKLMRNPEVTVRSRGVMEKCTYCIQRIVPMRVEMEKLQVAAEEEARRAGDEDVAKKVLAASAQRRQKVLENLQTACQQACPTHAIVFGNLNQSVEPLQPAKPSEARRLRDHPLTYSLLPELITKPRTTYLARITNPNESLGESEVPG